MKKLIITVLFMTMLNLTLFSQWITEELGKIQQVFYQVIG